MSIVFKRKGNFTRTTKYLERLLEVFHSGILDKYGRAGVRALSEATPVDTGKTAASWYYDIRRTGSSVSIVFKNRNVNDGVMIAILIQYDHATGWGGWVEGIDYINPAVRPLFKQLVKDIRKEVRKS